METMIEQYYQGEEGFDTLIDEDGFCAYRVDDNKNFYVGHVFMSPDKRKNSDKFFNKIRFRTKALGAERIVGDLFLNVHNMKGYNNKVTVFLLNGFKIIDVNDKCITVMKEL